VSNRFTPFARLGRSPADLVRKELGDEIFIERENRLHVWTLSPLRVQIVEIEFANPFEHALVLLVHEVPVGAVPLQQETRDDIDAPLLATVLIDRVDLVA